MFQPKAKNLPTALASRFLGLNRRRQVATKILKRRGLSSSSASSSVPSQPFIELREYNVRPGNIKAYMEATTQASELRKSLYPLRFFSLPDTGGQLLVPTHAYYYGGGHTERDETQKYVETNPQWQEYLDIVMPLLEGGRSNIYVEAPLVSQFDQVNGLKDVVSSEGGGGEDFSSILELRRYQLQLGYDTVPKFLQYYQEGLSSKLTAEGTDPTTSLVTLMYSDVGSLNEVIEIWRHGNGTSAMERSRVAARQANEWRTAIANIATLAIQFTSTIHRPTSFSPIK